MIRAYIGIGSNLNQPRQQVLDAIAALKILPRSRFVKASSLYETKPVGPQNQPDFMNAVAAIDTSLSAQALLSHLLAIEKKQGRVRSGERFGPRTLDLDLLLYGNEKINTKELTVPHPRMFEREFVLQPLAEIAPELCAAPSLRGT